MLRCSLERVVCWGPVVGGSCVDLRVKVDSLVLCGKLLDFAFVGIGDHQPERRAQLASFVRGVLESTAVVDSYVVP